MATVTTEVQLCNLALGFAGQRQVITSLTEESTEAQMCALYYPLARDFVLASRAWRFTTRRSVLALSTEERTHWDYVYVAPARMLKAHEIVSSMRPTPPGTAIPFDWELNDAGTGNLILTDEPDAELIYSAQVPEVGLFPPSFVAAVVWQLASYLAMSVPVKPQLAQWFESQAEKFQRIAAAADLNSAVPSPPPLAEVTRTRS
ncbi:MAG: hypothetical protein Q8L48_16750 [Archangium sp.]|nr:hypothetical protein [Archangium sp.]